MEIDFRRIYETGVDLTCATRDDPLSRAKRFKDGNCVYPLQYGSEYGGSFFRVAVSAEDLEEWMSFEQAIYTTYGTGKKKIKLENISVDGVAVFDGAVYARVENADVIPITTQHALTLYKLDDLAKKKKAECDTEE